MPTCIWDGGKDVTKLDTVATRLRHCVNRGQASYAYALGQQVVLRFPVHVKPVRRPLPLSADSSSTSKQDPNSVDQKQRWRQLTPSSNRTQPQATPSHDRPHTSLPSGLGGRRRHVFPSRCYLHHLYVNIHQERPSTEQIPHPLCPRHFLRKQCNGCDNHQPVLDTA